MARGFEKKERKESKRKKASDGTIVRKGEEKEYCFFKENLE